MNKKLVISIVVILLFIAGVWFFKSNRPLSNNGVQNAIVGFSKSGTQKYLIDTEGRTLYTSKDDGNLISTCVNQCLTQWPIFEFNNKDLSKAKDPLSKNINVIKRSDGFYQYAYGPQPLYYYSGDKNPGDKNGDGLGSIWNIVLIP